MDDLELGEDFSSLQLVDLMGEIVGCRISLDGQLQLSDYLTIDDNLQSDIADRNGVSKPTFNFLNYKPRVFFHKLFYLFYSFYDIGYLQKDTFSSDHITDFKRNSCSFFKELINDVSIVSLLSYQYLLYCSIHILLSLLVF